MTTRDLDENDTRRVRALLNRAADEIDDMTIARLRALRKRAVATGEVRQPFRSSWWLPLSTTAISAVFVASLLLGWWRTSEPLVTTVATDDIEWVVAKDGPDLLNDIDFYTWLDDENDAV